MNLLSHLGVMASSLFRSNAVVWVEGITDRRYIREFLRKFFKNKKIVEFKEDINYSFVELGGGNLVHFDFSGKASEQINVKRIVGSSFVVIDGDNDGKADRIQNLKKAFTGSEYLNILDEKEIENLLPEIMVQSVVKAMLSSSMRADKESLLANVGNIKAEEYSRKGQALGRYLDETLGIAGNSYFAAASGTLKEKMRFCDIAIDLMRVEHWTLTASADRLCERIFNFIKEQN
ncbi:hypothetical protein D3C87_1304200 [compost metagenome]